MGKLNICMFFFLGHWVGNLNGRVGAQFNKLKRGTVQQRKWSGCVFALGIKRKCGAAWQESVPGDIVRGNQAN